MLEKELKILMLEDLQDDVGLIERVLRKESFRFVSKQVDSREEFVAALDKFSPDVVLSDHALPQFNSVEALKLCKKHGLDIPFILVTGTVSEEFAVSCLKHGADDYVLKSNLARLPSAISNSLKKRQVETKRRKAEKALRKQNEELVKINKELDSFVYSVSHNLRAPLMSVLGLIQLAQMDDKRQNNGLANYFNLMETSIHRLDETLKEILDYSRNARSEIKIERISMRALLDESFERLRYLDGFDDILKNITVEESAPLYSDAYRLTVVFNNLISNAIKYRDLQKDKQRIDIRVTVTEKDATFNFNDNGIGIKEELVTKIFDMFFRATEKSEGAGLGLYIVKEAIDKLQGEIQVKSSPGVGTAFMITMPNRQGFIPVV